MTERPNKPRNEAEVAKELEELRKQLSDARADEPARREDIRRLRHEIADIAERLRRRHN